MSIATIFNLMQELGTYANSKTVNTER